MRKLTVGMLLAGIIFLLQCCGSTKNTTAVAPVAKTSWQKDVLPIVQASCAPCHIAGKGNKKSLDNFANAAASADDILRRIQLNPGERGFMPVRHDKLSDSAIAVFTGWKQDGLIQ